jgi:hypothetical protein
MSNTVFDLAEKLEATYSNDVFLGHLAWYAIPETTKVQHSQFEKALEEAGVDFIKLPPAPRPVDVFKRACTQAQAKKVEPDELYEGPATHFNYLFRNAGQDVDYVYRTLICEEVDAAGHEIGFTEVAKYRFTRSTSNIHITYSPTLHNPSEAGRFESNVRRYFKDNNDTLTPYAIREFVRKGLEGALRAVKVRPSGGIYFTQQAFSQHLNSLENAINSVGGSFHTLPLLDDGKQREMLRTAFENETTDEINTFVGEMLDITMSGKKITQDRYVEYRMQYQNLSRKIIEYSTLLDDALELSNARLDVMEAEIETLMDSVDFGV